MLYRRIVSMKMAYESILIDESWYNDPYQLI